MPSRIVHESPIAIVIPALKAAAFVAEAVESARRQRDQGQDIDVVVVVDGPDPETEATARAAGAEQVIVLPKRSGPGATRNVGARATNARLLSFLDADDRLRPGAIARLVRGLDGGAVVAYGEATGIDEAGLSLGPERRPWLAPRPSGDIRRSILARNPIATPGAAVITRAAFDSADGFSEHLPRAEDWALWSRVSTLGRFSYVGLPAVVERRWHPASTSATIGLSPDPLLRAITNVFADPVIIAGIPPRVLARLRRHAEAGAFALAATEHLKRRDLAGARGLLLHALCRWPRPREAVLLIAACLGVLPPALRRRLA